MDLVTLFDFIGAISFIFPGIIFKYSKSNGSYSGKRCWPFFLIAGVPHHVDTEKSPVADDPILTI